MTWGPAYYERDGVAIYHGDARDFPADMGQGCLVLDPPWDSPELYTARDPVAASILAFCDPRTMGQVVRVLGAPAWVFTWDTMNTWQTGPRRPVQQTKHCLWFGPVDSYARDAVLWGAAPPVRDHPTTKQTPLAGRRLTDLWRESLRWLHNGEAKDTGAERFKAHGNPAWRHAKPVGWLRCLIGNCSAGLVLDPFMGVGSAIVAARDLGRPAIGIEIDEALCEIAARRLDQLVLPL